MNQHEQVSAPPAPSRPALQRRAKHGVVAGYLHGLSQRHRTVDAAPKAAKPATRRPCPA
jgi:hypothetical protein